MSGKTVAGVALALPVVRLPITDYDTGKASATPGTLIFEKSCAASDLPTARRSK
jgi:hypothetical protein